MIAVAVGVAVAVATTLVVARHAVVATRAARRPSPRRRLPSPGVLAAAGPVARVRARHRQAAAERALPAALETVARAIRAGAGLRDALAEAAAEHPAARADLDAVVVRSASVGVVAALDRWGDTSTGAARLAARSLAVAAAAGGSPARAIDGVAATLRVREAAALDLRAASAQARLSAVVIGVAPVAFGALATAVDPATLAAVRSPAGLVLVGAGVALDALGLAWMLHLTRPEPW